MLLSLVDAPGTHLRRLQQLPAPAPHSPDIARLPGEISAGKQLSKEDSHAAWRKENPLLTPQQAVNSGAGLGPPSGSGRADNSPEKVHTEIRVNGKVIARTYNSGAIEIANEYGFLTEELRDSFAADRKVGPELAADRASRVKAALERHGMLPREELDANALLAATLASTPVVEMLRASTAQTQEEWLAFKATEAPMTPGAFLSTTA